jgi:hypothetical protein
VTPPEPDLEGIRDVPMAPERAVTGRVAAVYADIRARMPFVPSFFKSLALNPAYLELVWLQARERSDALDAEAEVLRRDGLALAAAAGAPVLPAGARDVLEPFGPVVPRMLLTAQLAAGLLRGEVPEVERPPLDLPPALAPIPGPAMEVVEPAAARGADRALYVDIQQTYGVPFVASLFRALAAAGELAPAWAVAGPFQRSPAGRRLAGELREAARARVLEGLRSGFAGPRALEAAGQGDAAAGLAELLDLYRLALPQAFAFAVLAR